MATYTKLGRHDILIMRQIKSRNMWKRLWWN